MITQSLKRTLPLGSGSHLGFPCCTELSLHHIFFVHGLFTSFAVIPSKQGPGPAEKHTQLCEPRRPATFQSRPFPGQFHRMWLTCFHLVLGHTPDWKRNEFPHTLPPTPQACWPLLLGRSAHQVTRPSLRCPLLTVPLSFVNLLSIPTNKPQPLGPQGSLLQRFMKPETTILPPLSLLPSGKQ